MLYISAPTEFVRSDKLQKSPRVIIPTSPPHSIDLQQRNNNLRYIGIADQHGHQVPPADPIHTPRRNPKNTRSQFPEFLHSQLLTRQHNLLEPLFVDLHGQLLLTLPEQQSSNKQGFFAVGGLFGDEEGVVQDQAVDVEGLGAGCERGEEQLQDQGLFAEGRLEVGVGGVEGQGDRVVAREVAAFRTVFRFGDGGARRAGQLATFFELGGRQD
jgi:hypothetical protein